MIEPLPLPSKHPGESLSTQLMYQGMQEKKVGTAELARRLGWRLPQVDRALDVNHHSRLDRMEKALGAIGKRLVVQAQKTAG